MVRALTIAILLSCTVYAQMPADQAKVITMKNRKSKETKCQQQQTKVILDKISDAVDEGECSVSVDNLCYIQFDQYALYGELKEKGYDIDKDVDDTYTISWCR
jgi:hypothetical protein